MNKFEQVQEPGLGDHMRRSHVERWTRAGEVPIWLGPYVGREETGLRGEGDRDPMG